MSAIAIERMKLEGRLSPEDLAMAENNLKGFYPFSIPHSAYGRCFASGRRQRSGGTAFFAGTQVTASKPKMLLSLRKSFNAKNLTFQTVEDGLKPEERLQYAGAHRSQCKMGS